MAGSLLVLMNGEHVGTWSVERGVHRFGYTSEWTAHQLGRPLSLSMPLRDAEYRGPRVESYFDNLLPDSLDIRSRIQARVGAASPSAFDLLSKIGMDCIGAVQLVHDTGDAPDIKKIDGQKLTLPSLAKHLHNVVSATVPGASDEDFPRLSLAGAQEKSAVLWHNNAWHLPKGSTPTTHILKLPMGRVGMEQADLTTSVENEWFCSRILAAFGIPVADSTIIELAEYSVLAVKRFDRRLSQDKSWLIRVPQEDFCQVTATPVAKKYESDGGPGIVDIMKVLLGSREFEKDRLSFFKAQILFWLLCAPDGHAKNYSVFIEPKGRFRLTPLYDVISAYPFLGSGAGRVAPQRIKMAMAFSGKNRHFKWSGILPRHIRQTGQAAGIGGRVDALFEEIIESADTALATAAAECPREFPSIVTDSIIDGVRRKIAALL